ncbi:hypothetical protein BDP27DRAFT_1425344 [Rhodocollybia butyracea]|uniref:Uncharacterized protein n=1 Tax=Rhodocollybia butyracea TaxID=206335 RepID=A0A9P5PMX2_9AGAR|nr:hypothetical protein BDP27DRAFT_1425344 [Rhodocollybia butyracea]
MPTNPAASCTALVTNSMENALRTPGPPIREFFDFSSCTPNCVKRSSDTVERIAVTEARQDAKPLSLCAAFECILRLESANSSSDEEEMPELEVETPSLRRSGGEATEPPSHALRPLLILPLLGGTEFYDV